MAEDCLNLGIFAPANATTSSKLPIMFFVQGGGFTSNSNGNFNGTGLVEASGGNMIVVRTNYRVGILGFLGGLDVAANVDGAATNNGLRDIIAAAQFVKEHAEAFGGNPNHIVLSGDSSGAEAIDILLASNNGTGWPDLFVGAAVESTGIHSTGLPTERESAFQNNLNSTGCLNATTTGNTVQCMRDIPIAKFQSLLTSDGWGPQIDGEICNAPHHQMYEQGRFQKIPVIYGGKSLPFESYRKTPRPSHTLHADAPTATSNEATATYISNTAADKDSDISSGLKSAVPSISNTTLDTVMTLYPASLNNLSFFSRDVARPSTDTAWSGKGSQWQRDAALKTELKVTCTAAFFSDMNAAEGNTANWHYRYNVLDQTPGGFADQGLFTPHTSELYAIWGHNNTDGGDPGCLELATDATTAAAAAASAASDAAALSCVRGAQIMQAYWISFVRALDPNVYRLSGTPEWASWSILTPNRMVFDNTEAALEVMGHGADEVALEGWNQRQRCVGVMMPLAKAVALWLREGDVLPAFANGEREDPTLVVLNGTTTAR